MSNLLYNALKKYPDLVGGVRDALGIDDETPGIERIGETLTPVIDIWNQPEWQFLRGEIPFSVRLQQAAVAAETSYCGVGLPAVSSYTMVIEKCNCATGAADSVFITEVPRATAAATLTAGSAALNRDERGAAIVGTFNLKQLETWTGTDPGNIGNLTEQILTSITEFRQFITLPRIIKPGGVFLVNNLTVNVQLTVNISGRFRAALATER